MAGAGGAPPTRKGWFSNKVNARIEARYNNTAFLRGTATTVTFPVAATFTAGATSTSATAGIGYGTGAGSATVTQATSRSTGVSITTVVGSITTDTTSLAAEGSAAFVVTATGLVAATDVIVLSQRSGSNGGNTDLSVYAVGTNQFSIRVSNNNAAAGTAETGAIIINYAIIKGVAA